MRVSPGVVLSVVIGSLGFGQAAASLPYHSTVITSELSAGEHFEKSINKDLVFRMEPQRLGPDGNVSGWEISLVRADDASRDYIYPVNPPLRFNGLQILGPGYGEDTRTSLGRPHQMRFLLSAEDYDRLWPFVMNALWPYNAADPEKAADQYVNALKSLPTGELKLTVLSYAADPTTGSIQHISFRAEFTAPQSFALDNARPEATDSGARVGDVILGGPGPRAQQTAVVQMQTLGEKDTLAAAKLSAKELRQIIDAAVHSAFDTPDSWNLWYAGNPQF